MLAIAVERREESITPNAQLHERADACLCTHLRELVHDRPHLLDAVHVEVRGELARRRVRAARFAMYLEVNLGVFLEDRGHPL